MDRHMWTRRRLLLTGLTGAVATGLLAACGGAPPSPTAAPAKPAEPTKPAAAAPTAAPAKPAEPTKPAAAAPTTAPAPAAKPTAAPAAAKPAAPAGQRVVIRDHDWLQGTPGQAGDFYDDFVKKFEDENPTIKVEREWFPRAEMHAKQLALAATGQIGDTVRINVAPIVSELQIKGIMHDLDSLWKNDTDWINKDQKQFWPGNIRTYTRDGKVWGLPVVGHPGCLQYYTNRTMVEKAGLKLPPADGNWSVEDFIALSKGLTKSEGGRTTVYGVLPCIGNEGIVAWLRAYGSDLFSDDGKKCLLNTAESKAAIKALASLYTEHKSAQPWAANLNAQELFQGGKVGIAILTSFAASAWPGQIAKLPAPFEMEVYANPLGPSGKHASQVSSDGKGVAKATKNPDKAWIVLSRLFTSQAHGLNRFLRGLGSPGSRNDVWDSAEFKQKAPKLQNIAKVLVLPPAPEMAPWNHPANGRYFEHEPILVNEFVKVTLGQITPEQFCDDVGKQIQDIMDKPPV